ncbi:aprataxin and PNK-like factor isoform X2 [Tigriopus californicus]|uniref:aprataxin and PNK-like factor isoform X2 n=1 Tax=Tigriopus californicus TaxID=6832 RepID=UPI0027DAAE97|nr:aprataxin and PNK-like factor isoform X2 [Tigriopus californicus]
MELSRVDGHQDEDEDTAIKIEGQPGQSVVLGRGQLLQIAEAGMSRKMAKITLTKESKSWILEAVHEAKPCYHDKFGDFKALMPGERVKIVDGLQFSLAINKYIFKSKTQVKAKDQAEKSNCSQVKVVSNKSSKNEAKSDLKPNPIKSLKDDPQISASKSPPESQDVESAEEEMKMKKDSPSSTKDSPVESSKDDSADAEDEEEEMDCDLNDDSQDEPKDEPKDKPKDKPKGDQKVASGSEKGAIHSNGEVKASTSKSKAVLEILKEGNPVEIAKKRDLPKWMKSLSIESAMLSTPEERKKEKKDTQRPAKNSAKSKDMSVKGKKKPQYDQDEETEDDSRKPTQTSSKSKNIAMKGKKKPQYNQDEETEDDSRVPKKRPAKTPVNKPSAKKKVPPRKDSRGQRDEKNKTAGKKPQASPRGKHAVSSSESDTDEDFEMVPAASLKKPTQKSNTVSKPKSATRRRKQCQFGSNCYRKNPQHRKELSHPGDRDYDSDPKVPKVSDSDDDSDNESDQTAGSDDDRPECDFGKNCYRKNPQHRKEYKHTTNPRPKRKAKTAAAAKKGKPQGSGSEYDGSFIDDDSDVKDISHDETSEEEYVPSEDD